MKWSATRHNVFNNPKHVVNCIAGLPGKKDDRVLNVRADGSHINSKGRPITLPDTGNNRNKRLEKLPKATGTARGSFGAGLSGYGQDYTKPRVAYRAQQYNRVARETIKRDNVSSFQWGVFK